MSDLTRELELRMTEAELQAAIVAEAILRKWFVYHTRDSRGSNPGFPDLVLVRTASVFSQHTSRLVFAELKKQRGKTTADQELWLRALRKVENNVGIAVDAVAELPLELAFVPSVEVYVWRPSDWLGGTIEKVLK